jgi:hypothetical protein
MLCRRGTRHALALAVVAWSMVFASLLLPQETVAAGPANRGNVHATRETVPAYCQGLGAKWVAKQFPEAVVGAVAGGTSAKSSHVLLRVAHLLDQSARASHGKQVTLARTASRVLTGMAKGSLPKGSKLTKASKAFASLGHLLQRPCHLHKHKSPLPAPHRVVHTRGGGGNAEPAVAGSGSRTLSPPPVLRTAPGCSRPTSRIECRGAVGSPPSSRSCSSGGRVSVPRTFPIATCWDGTTLTLTNTLERKVLRVSTVGEITSGSKYAVRAPSAAAGFINAIDEHNDLAPGFSLDLVPANGSSKVSVGIATTWDDDFELANVVMGLLPKDASDHVDDFRDALNAWADEVATSRRCIKNANVFQQAACGFELGAKATATLSKLAIKTAWHLSEKVGVQLVKNIWTVVTYTGDTNQEVDEVILLNHAAKTIAISPVAPTGTDPDPEQDPYDSRWSPSAAPLPVNAIGYSNLAEIECPSQIWCIATGTYETDGGARSVVDVMSDGAWTSTQIQTPRIPASPFAIQTDIACPANGSCTIVGRYLVAAGGEYAFIATLENGLWSVIEPPLPGDASGGLASLFGVSCPSTQSCVATGRYQTNSNVWRPLVLSKSAGGWAAASTVNCCADGSDGALASVDCPTATTCLALGSQGDRPTYAKLEGSDWQIRTQPGWTSSRKYGASRVDCSGPSACVGVGYYTGTSAISADHGVALTSTATAVTSTDVPSDTTTFPSARLADVSCPTTTTCIAVGKSLYNSEIVPIFSVLASGAWVSSTVPIPSDSRSAGSPAELSRVDCATAQFCAAAGDYLDDIGSPYASQLSLFEGGHWTSSHAPAPPGPATAREEINDVACPAPTSCFAVGWYQLDEWGDTLGMIETFVPDAGPRPGAPFLATTRPAHP